ncbi:PrkA family serine protein kinase [Candidatus Riflebacteria bacterium]
MSKKDKKDFFNKLDEFQSKHKAVPWEGSFKEYVEIVEKNSVVASLAHSRIYNMILSKGVEVLDDGTEHFAFFEDELFGIDRSLAQIMEYYKASAIGSDVAKRILLLYGPPSSGKSQFVINLKRGLEEYSYTDGGAVYAIADCPMNEEPLHLIPHSLRAEFAKSFGINIEGDLCPMCSINLKEKYEGNIYKVPVRRIFFSEKERVGVGTFVPSDPKSQDITELVGSIDLSTIGDFGSESDPRAYRFDGELNIASRGLVEFIEMLKADERFLYVLLTLSQEKNIKTSRFSLIYADEAIIAHTNEAEFNAFMADKKSEALQDRMIVIQMPYNLKVSDEVRIYQKLLRNVDNSGIHFAPHTLLVCGMFAILSRLEVPKISGLSLVKKMHLFNGEDVEGFTQKDIKQIREDTIREGMDGVSPRFLINRISSILTKPDTTCVNPIDALRGIKDGLDTHSGFSKEQKENYINLIADTRKEYDEIAKTEVQKAFFVSFEDEAKTLLNNYLDNVEAFLDGKKIYDNISETETEPNEKLMRSIEEKVKVSESGKDSFRNEIFRKVASYNRKGETFHYFSHEKLKKAIERQLFEERRDTIRLTISSRNPDKGELQRLNAVVDTLIKKYDYCTHCANELLKYVSSLLAREK